MSILPIAVREIVTPGADLAAILVDALTDHGVRLRDGDIVAVASKVVALAEGTFVAVPDPDPADPPRPAARAADLSPAAQEDPRRRAATARAARIVADDPRALVVATHHGFVCANAGIDASNLPPGTLLALPDDPDASARLLRAQVAAACGVDVGIVVTDTFGRPWRMGQVDVALGVAGIIALRDERGSPDLHDTTMQVTVAAVADAIACAADLVRSKASATPFVVVRGLALAGNGTGSDLVRPVAEDLFPAGGPTLFDHALTTVAPLRALPGTAGWHALVHDAVAVVAATPRPGVRLRAVAPSIWVDGPDQVAVGMAAEALRVALAGRGLAMEMPGPQDRGPGDDGGTQVRVTVSDPGEPRR